MERQIYLNETIIKKNNNIDSFSLQRVFCESGVGYKYKINGFWTDEKPKQKPEGKRIIFKDINSFRAVRDVYFAWQDIEKLRVHDPVKPEEIIKRLFNSRKTGNQLTLFTPWGVGLKENLKVAELVLDRIRLISNLLSQRNLNINCLLMPADLYATEINSIDSDLTTRYFEFVTKEAVLRGFKVKPWSEIRQENLERYRVLLSQLDKKVIREVLSYNTIDNAIEAAKRRNQGLSQKNIENAAFAYLRERICEAEIIEAVYKPIKISAVGKNKDNYVDCELPRLYIIPEKEQFPWLK